MEESVKKTSGLATAALVVGIIGIVFSVIPLVRVVSYPLGGLAIIFAIIPLIGRKSMAKSVVSLLLGVLSIVITFNLQAATVKAVDDALGDVSNSLQDMAGGNTDSILKNNLDVTIGKFTIDKGDFLDEYQLPITLKNKGTERKSFSVQIEAVDANGKRLDEDTVFANDLGAGQEQSFEAFTLITSDTAKTIANATFRIVEVSMY